MSTLDRLLMRDVARCEGSSFGVVCRVRHECMRFTQRSTGRVWMAPPEPDEIDQCSAMLTERQVWTEDRRSAA
ncbi:hypothetical protein [Geminicoccus harenae]|uniref:hypothetical protein n=1 Tax=Geminicoccus harenae TaxID=2498453 RepID=UPI00168ADA73|nr:hypothetical protein [Geminicoccus harenae]